MSFVDLVVLFILGLNPDWRPDWCMTVDMNQEICRARQEANYATAQLLAPIFVQEAERSELGDLGAFWLASIAQKENSMSVGDECVRTIRQERVSVTELDPSPAGERRVKICVGLADGRTSCRNGLVLEEDEEVIKINYCMAGEVGLFQLTRFEARAGTVVPATGEELPRGYTERRERLMDPEVNTSLASHALARLRDHCCEDDQECRENWDHWVGSYNTGRCTSTAATAYGARIRSYYERGLAYVCQEAPDAEVCQAQEPIEDRSQDQ